MRLQAAMMLFSALTLSVHTTAAAQDTTEVVILGVSHSAMLVAESYSPAVFRAYFDRVKPDAICIERSPEEFARGSHYEFTYEIQNVAVPYARAKGIGVCPFDWLPDPEDQMLAFGINVEEPPFLRTPRSYGNFLGYEDSTALKLDLFYAEAATHREENRNWYLNMPEAPRGDFARRLFLYRTFMQAMRIAKAANDHPGGRLLVVVGSMHKDDLERILKDQPGVRIVAPPHFGASTKDEIARHLLPTDLAAIATFNLLGAQSATGLSNWDWMQRIVEQLERERPGAETLLFRTRLEVLTGQLKPAEAAERYRSIRAKAASGARFTWDGVLDRRRVDSFADPFGNLTIGERAMVEEARALQRAGQKAKADSLQQELAATQPAMKAAQLRAYWKDWIDRK